MRKKKPEPMTEVTAGLIARRVVDEMMQHMRAQWDRELQDRVHGMVREHMEYIGRTAQTDNQALAARLLDTERVVETYAAIATACEKMRRVMERV